MSEPFILVGGGKMFMTAETRALVLARADAKPVINDAAVGWTLDGIEIVALTEEELREKARLALPYEPRLEPAAAAPRPALIARSVPVQHPRALSREAARRRRQMAKHAARKEPADV